MTWQPLTYRWDLLRQVNLLGQGQITLLQWAVEVDFLDLVTQINLAI